ncbi:hypothetical protein AB0J71_46505 [Nonomuraea sp. NPDC049637]|uniref:hypothetical protein n=1 Tax=Nonomuraea sp. NPDC049637 TaxID=3154356 RepID=UPI0034168461
MATPSPTPDPAPLTPTKLAARLDVWPLTADHHAIWLLSGTTPWQSTDLDRAPHTAAHQLLATHGISTTIRLLHSTSWRPGNNAIVLTYLAILDPTNPIQTAWPQAQAITAERVEAAGKPTPTPATQAPAPRQIDVLLHALRHLHFLTMTDTPASTALDDQWRAHLNGFATALSGLYTTDTPLTHRPRHVWPSWRPATPDQRPPRPGHQDPQEHANQHHPWPGSTSGSAG